MFITAGILSILCSVCFAVFYKTSADPPLSPETDPVFSEEIQTIEIVPEEDVQTLYHVLLLGQSLSLGYGSQPCLEPVELKNAYMFRQVRTQDMWRESEDMVSDDSFYADLIPLRETVSIGYSNKNAQEHTYETPASGVALGLYNAFCADGEDGLPWPVVFSAPGLGGCSVLEFGAGASVYLQAKEDMEHGRRIAEERGWDYRVLAILWMQGEEDYAMSADEYGQHFQQCIEEYRTLAKTVSGQEMHPYIVTYQTGAYTSYYEYAGQQPALAQFEIAKTGEDVYICAPGYQLAHTEDAVHLSADGSRDLGILLGDTLYRAMKEECSLFAPDWVEVDRSTALIHFPFPVEINSSGAVFCANSQRAGDGYGFLCYNYLGNRIRCVPELLEDGCTIRLKCSGESIHRISYGFDMKASQRCQHTIGGLVCRTEPLPGVEEELRHYMPVQIIYDKTAMTE